MNNHTMIRRLTAYLKSHANHDHPYSLDDIHLAMKDISRPSLTGAMSRVMMTERHIHRRWHDSGKINARGRKVPEYVYWYDADYLNPIYGRTRITQVGGKGTRRNAAMAAESGSMRAARVFVEAGRPKSTLSITVAGHSFTPTEARIIFKELKELFA